MNNCIFEYLFISIEILNNVFLRNYFRYVGSNGIEVEEKGTQKEIVGADGEKVSGTVSSGKYSYLIVGDGGKMQKMTVTWTADENGFRPVITISDAWINQPLWNGNPPSPFNGTNNISKFVLSVFFF